MVDKICPTIITISLNLHGTRVIQLLIEKLSKGINENISSQASIIQRSQNPQDDFNKIKGFKYSESHNQSHKILIQLITSIQDQAQQLMMDMYGNHVIQSFLNAFKAAEKPEEEDTIGTHQTNKLYTEFIFKTCIK